jgi:flagellar protein FliO/FliZ
MVLLTGNNSFLQLIAILLIFVVVLGVTAYTTKWIAGYQKQLGAANNIELLEAVRLGNNKYIQVIRLGEKYVAVAVCKDTVTVLCEIPQEQIKVGDVQPQSFKEIFDRMTKKDSGEKNEPKDDMHEE